jgi:HAD superfamily hydrolase (TIGR01509 family)
MTGPIHKEAFLKTLSELSIPSDTFEYESFAGLETPEVFQRFGVSENLIPTATDLKRSFYRGMADKVKPMEGAVELLNFLQSRKVILFAVSSGSSFSVAQSLKICGINHFFQEVITSENTQNSKPAPEPYLLAWSLSRVKKSECLVVEDSKAGLTSAHSSGLDSVLVSVEPPNYLLPTTCINFPNLFMLESYLKEGQIC